MAPSCEIMQFIPISLVCCQWTMMWQPCLKAAAQPLLAHVQSRVFSSIRNRSHTADPILSELHWCSASQLGEERQTC